MVVAAAPTAGLKLANAFGVFKLNQYTQMENRFNGFVGSLP